MSIFLISFHNARILILIYFSETLGLLLGNRGWFRWIIGTCYWIFIQNLYTYARRILSIGFSSFLCQDCSWVAAPFYLRMEISSVWMDSYTHNCYRSHSYTDWTLISWAEKSHHEGLSFCGKPPPYARVLLTPIVIDGWLYFLGWYSRYQPKVYELGSAIVGIGTFSGWD